MGVVSIPYTDSGSNQTGMVHLENGPWVGPRKILHFTDTLFGSEGTIICDCRESTPRIRFDQIFSTMRGVEDTSRVLTLMLRPFLAGQFANLPVDTVAGLYTRDYCLECLDPLLEAGLDDLEQTVAEQVAAGLGPGRVLVAGCGQGKGLLRLRELGADAWGVDLSPDLDEIVLPEARPWVRRGSVHDLPFAAEERFDVLLCLGVLEHLPEGLVEAIPLEAARLGIRQVVTLIDHDDFIRPGHLTLRPLSWWVSRFLSHYSPSPRAFPLPPRLPSLPWGPSLKQRLRLWHWQGDGLGSTPIRRQAEREPVLAGGPAAWDGPEGLPA